MDWYNRNALQVKDVGKKFIMNTLATTLRPCSFAESLFARPPITLGEMQERVVELIQIEEMRAIQKRQHEENASSSGQERKRRQEGVCSR